MNVVEAPVPGLPDYIRNSWRWNDPEALRFALRQAEESRAQADAINRTASIPGLLALAMGRRLPRALAPAAGLIGKFGAPVTAIRELNGWERERASRAASELRARLRELGVDQD
jgi:hypothetical protein